MRVRRSGRGTSVVALIAVATMGAALFFEPRPEAHIRISAVTWTEHVAPLVERRCVACHAPGHAAAPSLTEYADVVAASTAVKRAVLQRRMPPWRAVPGFGVFENDHSLLAHEVDLLVSWIEGGMSRGPSREEPAATPGAAIRPTEPELMLDVGREYPVDSLRRVYRIPIPPRRERWIRGWQIYPGNGALVRRARVGIAPDTWLGTWLPDEPGVMLPPGAGWRLPRGATLMLEIEYGEPPAPALDRSHVGLFLTDAAQRDVQQLRIRRGTTTLMQHVDLLALTPSLGAEASVRIVATRPDGSAEPLLWIRDYDPKFARSYRLQEPVPLPRGTRVEAWSFDAEGWVDLQYAVPAGARLSGRSAPRQSAQ
jgi:hypothetical protein